MKHVRDRLFLGNLDDAISVLSGSMPGMTHVLSLVSLHFLSSNKALNALCEWRSQNSVTGEIFVKNSNDVLVEMPPHENAKPINTLPEMVKKVVPLKDVETENLLDRLEECLEFIDQGRKYGATLVHCVAGVSRSAAVLTAYLMRSEQLSLNDALKSLKASSKSVCPNDGFMQQLQMFEDMGFMVDKSSPTYRRFSLENLGRAYMRGEKVDRSKLAENIGVPTSECAGGRSNDGQQRGTLYRCKKCRRLLASQENVMAHNTEAGKSFSGKKNKNEIDDGRLSLGCSSIFVEPMQWMSTVQDGVVEGKLSCSCETKLGSFNWAGLQCSCGAWVTPAFQVHKSRIDASWT